ncbi:MAG: SxtJ family membrane protein [Candidatus Krumholzibacteria bacterium]
MAMVELKHNPTKRELQWFGLIMLTFFGAVGSVVYFKIDAPGAGRVLWVIGALFTLLFYSVRPLRLPFYLGWMRAFYPLGWTVSHLVLVTIYYLVVTPIGLVLRVFRYDPLRRRRARHASSYWVEHRTGTDVSRYFRQY